VLATAAGGGNAEPQPRDTAAIILFLLLRSLGFIDSRT